MKSQAISKINHRGMQCVQPVLALTLSQCHRVVSTQYHEKLVAFNLAFPNNGR